MSHDTVWPNADSIRLNLVQFERDIQVGRPIFVIAILSKRKQDMHRGVLIAVHDKTAVIGMSEICTHGNTPFVFRVFPLVLWQDIPCRLSGARRRPAASLHKLRSFPICTDRGAL